MKNSVHIHKTAIISKSAELGNNVVIGAYSIVGDNVKIGDDSVLKDHVVIGDNTEIGSNNIFYPFASIGQRTQDLKYISEPTYLKIGNNNTFREFASVNRATNKGDYTEIGNDGNFLTYCHIAHDCKVGNNVIFSNNATLAGHVEIGDHCILGGLSAIHQFCKIGKHSLIGGCSKIVQDLPPFFIADGNPGVLRGINIVGLKRRGFSENILSEIKNFYKAIFLKKKLKTNLGLEIKEYLNSFGEDYIFKKEVLEIVDFINNSDRGIIR